MKIVLTDKGTNIVIDIVDSTIKVMNGLQVTNNSKTYVYAAIIASQLNQTTVDSIPDGIVAHKYKFTDGSFVENPNYIEPRNPE
jgi:hypothetical protein